MLAVLNNKREKELWEILIQMFAKKSGEEKEVLKEKFFRRLAEGQEGLPVNEKFIESCAYRAAEREEEEVFDRLLQMMGGIRVPFGMDRKYLYKIIERFGTGNHTWKTENLSLGQEIPGIYAAIIEGDVELVRYYIEHGVKLKPDHTEEFLLFGESAGLVYAVQENEKYPAL